MGSIADSLLNDDIIQKRKKSGKIRNLVERDVEEPVEEVESAPSAMTRSSLQSKLRDRLQGQKKLHVVYEVDFQGDMLQVAVPKEYTPQFERALTAVSVEDCGIPEFTTLIENYSGKLI